MLYTCNIMFPKVVRLCTSCMKCQAPEDFIRQMSKTASVGRTQSKMNVQRKNYLCLEHITVPSRAISQITSTSVATKEESREFMAVFPDIVRDLTDAGRHTDIPEITKWYSKILQYNVPGGKINKGLVTVMAYKLLEDPKRLTPENIRNAILMGWCIEMLQAFFVVVDDVMDASETRHGVPCWYKLDGIGNSAFNDAILLENGVYSILRKYFRDHPCYIPVMELFHDVTLKSCLGQTLDIHSAKNGKPDLNHFSMDRYNSIAKYKSVYSAFQLPVSVSMYLSGIYDEELHRQAKTIFLEMGHFYQVQNDFLDCFGNPEVTGKEGGNDIREGKCTWLSVVALQRASPAQKEVMQRHYGCSNEASVQAVRDIYEEQGIPNTYAIYEEETYNRIHTHIQQMSGGLPHEIFFNFLKLIYRQKL